MIIKDVTKIKSDEELLERAKWLVGKTLEQIVVEIQKTDEQSRVTTKAGVGYAVEKGFFGIDKNSRAGADIEHLGIEIKTCPLKYNADRTRLSVKEPLSLNIINYITEADNDSIKDSSLYKKNKKILFVMYIHDKAVLRSKYVVKYVFLWKMGDAVINELTPDYNIIMEKIRAGKAHEIHQSDNKWLTLCPKHSGKFSDPNCRKSKRTQPFSDIPAEVRAYRLKNPYMNKVICEEYGFLLGRGGWPV